MDYYPTISAQETKQTNKIFNLNLKLTWTVSCKKRCLIRRKKENKWINNNKEINLDLDKKLVRFIPHLKNTSTTRQTVKKTHKKKQSNAYITPAMGYYPKNG